jgi:hypothetical protein
MNPKVVDPDTIDIAAIKSALHARDVQSEGDGLVVVWDRPESWGGAMNHMAQSITHLVWMLDREIVYFTTAFNRNAYSMHVRFQSNAIPKKGDHDQETSHQ